MSPTILPAAAMLPSARFLGGSTFGATTSAIGRPKRVTLNGRPVKRTRSSAARQVALNFEIGIESTWVFKPWSTTMVNSRTGFDSQVSANTVIRHRHGTHLVEALV